MTSTGSNFMIIPTKQQLFVYTNINSMNIIYLVFGLSWASILITWIIPFLHKSAAKPVIIYNSNVIYILWLLWGHPLTHDNHHNPYPPCTGKLTACLSACDLSWGFADFRLGNHRFLLHMVDKQPIHGQIFKLLSYSTDNSLWTFLSSFRDGAGDKLLYIWKFFCAHKNILAWKLFFITDIIIIIIEGDFGTYAENWLLIL